MENVEQVFFNVPLSKLEPIFKRWVKEAQTELQPQKSNQPNPDRWFDLNELVDYDPEKRSKPTFYNYVHKGTIPYHKRKKKLIFLKSEIDEWLKSGRVKTNAEIETDADDYLTKKGLKNGK